MKRLAPPLSLVVLAAACGGNGSGTNQPDAGPAPILTYYQHVKPLVDAKCTSCHIADGIAPFPMTEYAHFEDLGSMIKSALIDKIMPPWLAADGCNDYYADRSLSDEQIALVVGWIDQGMLEGDPADEGPPLEVETVALSREDVVLTMPVSYTPQVEPDDYRCFLLDWPETETRYVTGFRADPGVAQVVHHVIAYLIPPDQVATYDQLDADDPQPGYTCFGGPGAGQQGTGWLGSWAPGGMGSDYPPGSGYRVEPGSKVALQVHYNTINSDPVPDQTSIAFKVDAEVEKPAVFIPFTDYAWVFGSGMSIPAGDPDVMHAVSFDISPLLSFFSDGQVPSGAYTIHAVGLHMHTLGTSGVIRVERAGGDECLLSIPRWNFHWQGGYALRQPVTVQPGENLYLECHWDNSAANQPVVDGVQQEPRDLSWGERTTDEMCLAGLYVTSVD